MRFALLIEQDVSRFDVAMQNSMLMRVMNGARHLRDQFRRLPDRHRRPPDYFIQLSAFDELHAEVTRPVALADFVNRHDARMLQTRRGFCFKAKTLQVSLARPLTKANDF